MLAGQLTPLTAPPPWPRSRPLSAATARLPRRCSRRVACTSSPAAPDSVSVQEEAPGSLVLQPPPPPDRLTAPVAPLVTARLGTAQEPGLGWAAAGQAAGGSRRKAEMYLVRTDGFTCTRETVRDSTLRFGHPSTQQQLLIWKTRPQSVLILKKLGDDLLPQLMAALRLLRAEGLRCVVEPEVYSRLEQEEGFGFVETFVPHGPPGALAAAVDFAVCLGGDGVILHASSLFSGGAAPPLISFNLGSLGFLTAHLYENLAKDLHTVLNGDGLIGGVYITLRMRLRCELIRGDGREPPRSFDVLNEVVVNRGNNPFLSKIECYERDRLITKVQADGIMIATPTGSTAYSVAAGGSLVHPNVPAILFTPVCPHALSFRPVVLPDSAELELRVPGDARNSAWVSFDGQHRHELRHCDAVRVRMSEFPLPTINKADQTNDWFASLGRCLAWNDRVEQGARRF